MKKVLFPMLALILMLGVTLFVASPAGAISGGQLDTSNMYPNVGAIVVDVPGSGPLVVGSGALIGPQVFLTAGHIVAYLMAYGVSADEVFVSFAPDPLANVTSFLPVSGWFTPFNGKLESKSNAYDVGVLILQQEVTGITPAALAPEGFLDTQLRQGNNRAGFTVVGYGETAQWPPPKMTYDPQRRYAECDFQTLLPSWLVLSQNPAKGNGATCLYDSGGPVFWTDADTGTILLVGITSRGDLNTVGTGFYYRVDIPATLSFLNSLGYQIGSSGE